jgi:prolyl oligopeptidase
MKRLLVLYMILNTGVIAMAQPTYPETKRGTVTDNYFGTTVADPYRWLEDDNSAETKAWVTAQNKVTRKYLDAIPFRPRVKNRLTELWNFARYGNTFQKGEYIYFAKNEGLQNQAVYYRQKGLNGEPEIFIDPNTLSKEGTAAVDNLSFSKTGKFAAYTINKAGSDWADGYVMNVSTKKPLTDKLEWLKFTGFSWKGDEGFYYSRYPAPSNKGSKLSNQNELHTVYYHRLGTPQADDVLIYQDTVNPLRYHSLGVTEDQQFIILYISVGTSGVELRARRLADDNTVPFTTIFKGFNHEASVVDNNGSKFIVSTNKNASNYQVVAIDYANPSESAWQVIVPEKKEAISSVSSGGGRLFVNYMQDASTRIYSYDYDGKNERAITLPGIGTAEGFSGEKQDLMLFFTFTSFTSPTTVYSYNPATSKTEIFRQSDTKFNLDDYQTEQVFFKSKDGASVPIFLSYKKGLQRNGANPVLLYGYGGFNVPLTPSFSISNLYFMEQGGVYASVNLRGGNEYGETWHKAGMLHHKQTVFDDMIGAAEYLIHQKYTSKEKLAVRGGSNGGLLVGACITQRPDLFKVAIPQVGVMDMLRFHKFTIGHGWVVEYGSSDTAADFNYLYKYSPLHNIKEGTAYPATLITTADHDDRVVPAHSFKFAAAMQAAQAGANPILIRIDTNAGHGAGKPTSKVIDEATDIWSFIMQELRMQVE